MTRGWYRFSIPGALPQAYSSLGTQWLMRGHRFNPVLWDAVIEVSGALLAWQCIL